VRYGYLAFALAFAGCGAGGDGSARVAAVQKALDAHPRLLGVPRGKACKVGAVIADDWMDPQRFAHVKEVKIKPAGTQNSIFGPLPCYTFTWDSSVAFGTPAFHGVNVSLGRFIVDKVGDDETVGSVQAAPFRAHFEASEVGKDLIAAQLAQHPDDIANGHAMLTKDADGNFVAEIQPQ
jgi:hypothetical protein